MVGFSRFWESTAFPADEQSCRSLLRAQTGDEINVAIRLALRAARRLLGPNTLSPKRKALLWRVFVLQRTVCFQIGR